MKPFSLVPFPGEDDGQGIAIAGSIGRRGGTLRIDYALRGRLEKIDFPPPVPLPARKDRLWEETCLELFLAPRGGQEYWEVNLSPSGHWNIYRFTSYREGMREEAAYAALPFEVRREPGALSLSLALDVGRIDPTGRALEAAVSAVVKSAAGATGHWALAHPGPRPDFHRRDGFLLDIA